MIVFTIFFLIFLFSIHRLIKEDHVFLRKNIKQEQIFDTVFIITIVGVIFAKIFSSTIFFPIPQILIGSGLCLWLYGKYKKIPVGRLFDFFSMSFLLSIPYLFLIIGLFLDRSNILIHIVTGILYLIFSLLFLKYFFPKTMNRKLADGRLSSYILVTFSSIFIANTYLVALRDHLNLFRFETIYLMLLFLISAIGFIYNTLIRSK